MVIAESKPVAEILEMIKDCKKVIVAGCKGCVTVCNSGGEKEVGILSSELRIARKSAGQDLEVVEYTRGVHCLQCGAPICGFSLPLCAGLSGPEHHLYWGRRGARRLEGILSGLRQLHYW
jgi:Fe-S-cluster-containing dehydrogenase component